MPKLDLRDYVSGPLIDSGSQAHPEGSLVLKDATISLISNGVRRAFASETVFKNYGFKFGYQIVPANAAGQLMLFRDGTLVRQGSTIYLISDGKLLAFSSKNAFLSRGYKFENVINADVSEYPRGDVIN